MTNLKVFKHHNFNNDNYYSIQCLYLLQMAIKLAQKLSEKQISTAQTLQQVVSILLSSLEAL